MKINSDTMIKIVHGPLGDLPKKCPDSWRYGIFPWRRRKSLEVVRLRIRYFEFELEFFEVPEPGGMQGPDLGPIPLELHF